MKHKKLCMSFLALLIVFASAGFLASNAQAASTKKIIVKPAKIQSRQPARVPGAKAASTATSTANLKIKAEEMKAKQDAVKAAIEAGDYEAWVKAEKAMNAKSKLLEKITADNFSKYVEAIGHVKEANAIMKDLGLGEVMMPGQQGQMPSQQQMPGQQQNMMPGQQGGQQGGGQQGGSGGGRR